MQSFSFSVISRQVLAVCLLLGSFLLSQTALAEKYQNYTVLKGDVNSDGAGGDLYFSSKKIFLLIGGNIPMYVPGPPQYALYFDSASQKYGAPVPLVLTDAQISSLGLVAAVSGTDYMVVPDLDGNGRQDLIVQGESDPLDSLVLLTVYNQLPHVATIPANGVLSLASGVITVADYNADGLDDLYVERLGGYAGSYYIAYADSTGQWSNFQSIPLPPSAPPETPLTPQLATAPSQSDPAVVTSDSIGSTAGQFRVDESGAATYSIPIVAPTGTAGVAPQVSLNYSSQAGNGLVGKGWSIGGLSAISRCRQTLGQDGTAKPITWSAEDRFCLDGQRLIVEEGLNYGAIRVTYKTEIDSFATITSHGGSAGHPDYFTVVRKDGSISTYGNTPDSKQKTGDNAYPLTWAQNRFQDSVGNSINYVYYNDTSGHRIKEIRYAYGAGSVAGASLEFRYLNNRPDKINGYLAGYAFQTNSLLNQILAKNTGNSVRTYHLNYRQLNPFNDIAASKLASVQECIGSKCLPATSFEWVDSQLGFSSSPSNTLTMSTQDDRATAKFLPADINGDGISDMVWQEPDWDIDRKIHDQYWYYVLGRSSGGFSTPTLFYSSSGNTTKPYPWEVIDYNADGRSDVTIYTEGAWVVFLSQPLTADEWLLQTTAINTGLSVKETTFTDVNSDGLVDAVYIEVGELYVRKLQVDTSQPISSHRLYHFGAQAHIGSLPDGNVRAQPVSNLDFNGDGMGDLYQLSGVFFAFSSNSDTLYTSEGLLLNDTSPYTTYFSYADDIFNSSPNIFFNLQGVDLNGDGLSDILYQLDPDRDNPMPWYYRINNGNGFNVEQLVASAKQLSTADYNQDGYMDVYWHDGNAKQLKVRLWNPSSGSLADPLAVRATNGNTAEEAHQFADVTGDGVIDYMHFASDRLRIYPGKGANQPSNLITHIRNGLGASTKVTYKPLSVSGHYERLTVSTTETCQTFDIFGQTGTYCTPDAGSFYEALNSDWDLPAGNHSLGKSSPVLELNAPVYVVTAVEGSAPTADAPQGKSKISYFYGEAKIQAAGRGLLGFHKIKTRDEQTGIETTTTYRQDFPFIGFPLSTEVRTAGGDLLSEAVNTSVLQGWDASGTPPSAPYRPYIHTSVEKTYRTTTNLSHADKLNVYTDVVQTVTTTHQYDDHGNPKEVKVVTAGGDVTATKTIVNQYGSEQYLTLHGESFSFAELGRLTRTTVTNSRSDDIDGTPTTRTSAFTYYTTGAYAGLLESEIIEPDQSIYKLTTTYNYDAWGNKKKATQSGNGVISRVAETAYGSFGRYVSYTKNAYGQITEKVVSRNDLGQPTVVEDINGVLTQLAYGRFGRPYFEASETGAYQQTLLSDCDASCPTGAEYFSTTIEGGGAERKEYFDVLGRTVRVSTRQFDGTWGHVDTEYDNLGRVKRQSEPHAGSAQYWTTFIYDILGRVVRTDLPGVSNPVLVSYDGLTTVTTNPASQTKTEINNALGELTNVYDAENGHLSYAYDAAGNLRTTTNHGSPSDPHTIVIEMCYDALGRKVAMSDPDKGGWLRGSNNDCPPTSTTQPVSGWWIYGYNAFGELTLQIDAKGQASQPDYDLLGRMVTRVDKRADGTTESSTIWSYNNATTGSALGALTGVDDLESGYSKTFAHDSFGRVIETTLSLDEGQPDDTHFEKVTFDEFGRVFQQFDAAGDGTWQDNAVQHVYNAYGYLKVVKNAVIEDGAQTHYYIVEQMDLRGNVTEYLSGNGVTSTRYYDPATGRLENLQADLILGSGDVQDHTYSWDDIGNLLSRHDQSGSKNLIENFTEYDDLNRLKTYQVSGQVAKTVDYNSLGNITFKSDVGTYQYGAQCASGYGPHAVCQTSGTVNASYAYDANGNMTSGDGRTLTYTTFDKPNYIHKGDHTTTFKYGPDHTRYLRTDTNSGGTTTTRYIGNVEKITKPDGSKEIKRYLPGGALITINLDNTGAEIGETAQYLYKDHLGSIDVITDATGAVVRQMSFDAWGQRRAAINWVDLDVASLLNFDHGNTARGFTGHEMLDEVGLINMNGRVYDPRLARFIQADPIIQDTSYTQSFNRYSYGFNNPLVGTDPSGFIFGIDDLIAAIVVYIVSEIAVELEIPWLATLAQVVGCAYGYCTASTFAANFAVTGDLGYSLSRAAFTAVSINYDFGGGGFQAGFGESGGLELFDLYVAYEDNKVFREEIAASTQKGIDARSQILSAASTNSALTGNKFTNGAGSCGYVMSMAGGSCMLSDVSMAAEGVDPFGEELTEYTHLAMSRVTNQILQQLLKQGGKKAAKNKGKGVSNPEVGKLERPPIPANMTQSEFGKKVIQWGKGPRGALDRLKDINRNTVAKMKQQGLTREMAQRWRDFYANEFRRNANNTTAENRVKLMEKVLENF